MSWLIINTFIGILAIFIIGNFVFRRNLYVGQQPVLQPFEGVCQWWGLFAEEGFDDGFADFSFEAGFGGGNAGFAGEVLADLGDA